MIDYSKKTYQQLVKILDREVSIYVRKTHQFGDGYCACYTCGKVLPIGEIDAGHYISRRFYATRYELDNIRPQCTGCNKYRGGEPVKFRMRLVEEIGEERVRRLESLAVMNGDKHLPREELIGKIKEFKAKNKEVENG